MKGGINFEEWKEIVKKNRRSLRSKSNIFRFEPESLTYGAEKAVKSPEYGQVHTITYNVTGVEVPSDWPIEIKSGKTLSLSIPEGYEMAELSIDGTTLDNYKYENGVITVNNVQHGLAITLTVSPPINVNGHEYVDLGLPSGTLWATMNLGANSIYDFGDEYKIGYVTPYDEQTQSSGFDYSGLDNTDPRLPLQNDAAHYAWGGAWRMPTYDLWLELKNNTTQIKEDGFIKVRGINGNELIFPYRSISLNSMLLNTIYSYGMSMYGIVLDQNTYSDEVREVFLNSSTSGTSFIHAAVRPVIG